MRVRQNSVVALLLMTVLMAFATTGSAQAATPSAAAASSAADDNTINVKGKLVDTREKPPAPVEGVKISVEDDAGGRYWLFREGLYGREFSGAADERAPSWWMHGVLA